ncbi:hypothetical protein VIGAN_08077800 [Vigna angularis var. angularis]|uniref:Uncharacterized protein n=1 Tax=Vigna angularis var. angularis TaxID=157739 RepID=A0A0S3SMZ5_PHAAN|nr:hypothetical protein VIGAN_08077800 [Vigna angularis var. angularis]
MLQATSRVHSPRNFKGSTNSFQDDYSFHNFCFKYPSLLIFVQFLQFPSKSVLVLISMKLQFSVMPFIRG